MVDDHSDTREMLTQALTFCGAVVRDASSAHDAVALLVDVDVVITDLAMPEEDGVWLLGEVRRLPRRILVVALTGIAAQHDKRLASAGFDRVILKPVDPFYLCELVEAALRE